MRCTLEIDGEDVFKTIVLDAQVSYEPEFRVQYVEILRTYYDYGDGKELVQLNQFEEQQLETEIMSRHVDRLEEQCYYLCGG